jgi:hypothetical protein
MGWRLHLNARKNPQIQLVAFLVFRSDAGQVQCAMTPVADYDWRRLENIPEKIPLRY